MHWPAHSSWELTGDPFRELFAVSPYLFLGSMVAYLVSQLIDVQLFGWLRERTSGRHLWLRNNVSTMIAQAIDTAIISVIFLLWGLGMPLETALSVGFSSYLFKLCYALIDTPLCYLAIRWIPEEDS